MRAIVADAGGEDAFVRYHHRLLELVAQRPGAVVPSEEGAVEDTYQRLVSSLT